MQDSLLIKNYLRFHGVENVSDLSYDEIQEAYEKCVREGVNYYNALLYGNDFLSEGEKLNVVEHISSVSNIDELYNMLYKWLHFYTPSDISAFMTDINLNIPINYIRLQNIVNVVFARVQEELIDKISLNIQTIPNEERQNLITYYETIRDDVVHLQKINKYYSSKSTIDYLRETSAIKFDIVKTHFSKNIEHEYKAYFDNTKEKKELVANILAITRVYTKNKLFDMTINELNEIYTYIIEQNKINETKQRLLRKYIDIFEEIPILSDNDFTSRLYDATNDLGENMLGELAIHFSQRNQFISNKINAFLARRK